MPDSLDPRWYREEARRLRQRAATVKEDDPLRDSYLRLAAEYEKLAELLERRRQEP